MDKKKTCVLIVDNSPVLGGAELYPIELAERIDKDKVRYVFAITHVCRREYLENKGIETVLFTSNKLKTKNIFAALWNLIDSIFYIVRIVKRYDVDILQANTARMHIIATAAALLTHRSVIWVHHAYDVPLLLHRMLSIVPAQIICVSKTVMQHYVGTVKDQSKVGIIYNGIDFGILDRERRSDYFEKYKGSGGAELKIGAIGRIEARKGQLYLIKSMALVLKSMQNVRLYIIGDIGPGEEKYEEKCRELIEEIGLTEKVVFTGFVKERYAAMDSLDVIVQPSTLPESFGRVLTEGMALGKPIIATDIGAFLEIIQDGVNGLLVPPCNEERLAEAILKLAKDRHYASMLGSSGRKTVFENYNMDSTIAAYMDMYSRIAARG